MVKTDPKITSRKAVLDSDDELKESAVKTNTTPNLGVPAPATAEATIVTIPNSEEIPVASAPANPSARVPASRALGEFLELFEAKEQLYGNKAISTSKKRSTPLSKSSGKIGNSQSSVPVETVSSNSSGSSRTQKKWKRLKKYVPSSVASGNKHVTKGKGKTDKDPSQTVLDDPIPRKMPPGHTPTKQRTPSVTVTPIKRPNRPPIPTNAEIIDVDAVNLDKPVEIIDVDAIPEPTPLTTRTGHPSSLDEDEFHMYLRSQFKGDGTAQDPMVVDEISDDVSSGDVSYHHAYLESMSHPGQSPLSQHGEAPMSLIFLTGKQFLELSSSFVNVLHTYGIFTFTEFMHTVLSKEFEYFLKSLSDKDYEKHLSDIQRLHALRRTHKIAQKSPVPFRLSPSNYHLWSKSFKRACAYMKTLNNRPNLRYLSSSSSTTSESLTTSANQLPSASLSGNSTGPTRYPPPRVAKLQQFDGAYADQYDDEGDLIPPPPPPQYRT